MTRVNIPSRFLFDSAFFSEVSKQPSGRRLFNNLQYINARAKPHERRHNCMSKKVFESIVAGLVSVDKEKNDERVRGMLKSAFHPIDDPVSIENIDDEVERNIKYAIRLAEGMPADTIIFTTETRKAEYLENPHYKTAKAVIIKSDAEALNLLSDYFQQVCD